MSEHLKELMKRKSSIEDEIQELMNVLESVCTAVWLKLFSYAFIHHDHPLSLMLYQHYEGMHLTCAHSHLLESEFL